VQQVDPAFMFENGDAARAIRRISHQQGDIEIWLALHMSVRAIKSCVYESIYQDHFRTPLKKAAKHVIEISESYIERIYPKEGKKFTLEDWEVDHLKNVYSKFETILISELQSLSIYLVTRKSGLDISSMVDSGKVFFSKDLEIKVPSATPDLEQAMRCIAFELPTAAGFHLHRANEAVLRVYWDSVTDGATRPSKNNMGVYLSELEKKDKGNKSVRAHLQSIKDFHRNPLMHPDQSLDSLDEAIDLMAAVRCAIGYMLKEISAPTPPLLEVLTPE